MGLELKYGKTHTKNKHEFPQIWNVDVFSELEKNWDMFMKPISIREEARLELNSEAISDQHVDTMDDS